MIEDLVVPVSIYTFCLYFRLLWCLYLTITWTLKAVSINLFMHQLIARRCFLLLSPLQRLFLLLLLPVLIMTMMLTALIVRLVLYSMTWHFSFLFWDFYFFSFLFAEACSFVPFIKYFFYIYLWEYASSIIFRNNKYCIFISRFE